jgi:hypothetical protein
LVESEIDITFLVVSIRATSILYNTIFDVSIILPKESTSGGGGEGGKDLKNTKESGSCLKT